MISTRQCSSLQETGKGRRTIQLGPAVVLWAGQYVCEEDAERRQESPEALKRRDAAGCKCLRGLGLRVSQWQQSPYPKHESGQLNRSESIIGEPQPRESCGGPDCDDENTHLLMSSPKNNHVP